MKKLIYFGMGMLLCLSAAVWTGCDKDKENLNESASAENGEAGEGYVERAFGMELQMVYVEGGTFMMGATEEQGDDASEDEKPVHKVTLDDFYIGKFEVTQSQWEAVMGTTLEQQRGIEYSDYSPEVWPFLGVGATYPMYFVSWEEAQAFCVKLGEMTDKTYRLPTEAEWEYAARGGNRADGTKYAGNNDIDEVAWYDENSCISVYSDWGTHPVGQKKPNGLGLCDMSGNVWEWCSDWYDSYNSSPVVNPQGPSSGTERMARGGCWEEWEYDCRVSSRTPIFPNFFSYRVGFRIVCEAK